VGETGRLIRNGASVHIVNGSLENRQRFLRRARRWCSGNTGELTMLAIKATREVLSVVIASPGSPISRPGD
jgi:membrane glycosyltransferase